MIWLDVMKRQKFKRLKVTGERVIEIVGYRIKTGPRDNKDGVTSMERQASTGWSYSLGRLEICPNYSIGLVQLF